MYHYLPKTWRFMFHTLYYKCYPKPQNHFFFFEQGNYTHQYMLIESIFSHTLYYKCCIKLQNNFLLSTRKLHLSIHASWVHPFVHHLPLIQYGRIRKLHLGIHVCRIYPFFHRLHHCFNMIYLTLYLKWDNAFWACVRRLVDNAYFALQVQKLRV